MRVIAHRTCPEHAPENSLEGIAKAAELGADAVEVDVRLTSDGVPVLNHDTTVWRIARWPLPVRWTSSARFDRLRRRDGSGAALPTFANVLASLPAGLGLAIDVKDPAALDAVLAKLQAWRGDRARIAVWIRDPDAIRRVAAELPGTDRALLQNTSSESRTRGYLADAVECDATEVSIHQDGIAPWVVAEAHRLGLRAYCWIIDMPRLPEALLAGVDGIVTDFPEQVTR
ncbi:MAG: glycerophosphoryl diester phosphodiesterase [Actinomycetota bacterium]|jgi:glycerophosphoryl diester phosphodiesterase